MFEMAIEIEPANYAPYLNLGSIYQDSQMFEKTDAYFLKGIGANQYFSNA